MKSVISFMGKFLLAAVISTVLCVLISSQRVVNLLPIEDSVSFGKRLSIALYDLQHFAPLFGVFVMIALLIAFLAAALLYRQVKFGRMVIFAVAGGVAIWVMLWAMEQVFFGVPIVAGARDFIGMLLQILSGAVGGLLFAALTNANEKPRQAELNEV